MNNELEKMELRIEMLKAAIQMTQRKAKVLDVDLDDRIDKLLELLTEALNKRDQLKKK